jgi:DNA-binding XRE family transcriptional regulator
VTAVATVEGDLTKQEQQHVRAALRFLRARMGGWSSVSKTLRFNENTLSGMATGHRAPSVILAFRIAKLVKVGVDDVLAGRFPAPGTCPHCGHRREDTP